MAFPSRQNPFDWFTQYWNIVLGDKVNAAADAWLTGPIGEISETAEQFMERLAREQGLTIRRNQPDAGLIETFDPWEIQVNAGVSDFYRSTSNYGFDVRSAWKPVFGSLGWLVGRLFSRRIQQLNLPRAANRETIALQSDIIQLVNAEGRAVYTIWHRSVKKSREVVFYGIYTVCRIPSGELCVKAVFPLPKGSATVIFRVEADAGGNISLLSSGKSCGDPGFYFLVEDADGCLWKHYLPALRERISVSHTADGGLKAGHTMTLWSLKVYAMDYTITKTRREEAE